MIEDVSCLIIVVFCQLMNVHQHREQMTSRDRAQARTLHVDFQSYGNANDRRPGPSRQDRSGRGFSIQTSQQVNGTIGHDDRRGAQQQQLSSSVSMTPEAAAQHARQLNTDRQEDSRRRKAFVTSLTDGIAGETSGAGSGRDHDLGGRSGFATPREDVDDASAQCVGPRVSCFVSLAAADRFQATWGAAVPGDDASQRVNGQTGFLQISRQAVPE